MTNDKLEAYPEMVSCLDDLVRIYRSLLEVVRREREILSESRLDELNDNNKTKDALLVRVRTLENSRSKLARDLAAATSTNVDQPRLLEIAANLPIEQGNKLRNMHSVLELLIRRVSEVNKQNEELVQAALRTITGAMAAIKDGLQPATTYEKKGAMTAGKSGDGAFVSRDV